MSSSLRFQDFSTLQKNVQQWLKHPAVWSGIVSVGAHGLLFALLPLLPGDALKDNPPDLQRSVDLVELTPEEQQRLPDFQDQLPIELPSIAQTPPQPPSDLFTLPPLPSETLPPLAPPFANPLPLPSFPIFPVLPPPRPLQIPVPTTPRSPQANPAPSPQASPAAASPQPSATPAPNASPGAEPSQTAENAAPENPTASPQPSAREQLIARQRELRELYAYNPEGTSNEAFRESGTSWLEQVSTGLGDDWNEDAQKNLAPSKVVELSGAYPRAACPRRLSAAVMLGVVVDGEGKLVQEPVPPTVLQSSGYRILNQLAIEAVAAHEFEASGKRLPYYVRVLFEPNNEVCPPGAAPQPGETPASEGRG